MSHTDVPGPFIVRAEVTADNTSIRVSWKWLCQGMPMYINHIGVDYQPEGGSLMMYTVNNTTQQPVPPCTTSSATQSILCGFRLEVVRLIEQIPPEWFLYQQEVCIHVIYTFIQFTVVCNTIYHLQLLPLPLMSLLRS